ncbi:Pilin (type 1 fimbria component protein) [Pseudomonas sp. LAMO17WK12:I10]|uniref:fimbrial protein n=1 Tax=unclassified Pseudomonas TaxID=196821 RepID=UPI000BCC53B3|nr:MULTISPECIES: fimbrial protein [unclassified Pseudomonas]PXX73156.1 type 1 fimbria pilin [Pseudomonas sp. LAMO17WK12:I9]SNY28820.1 Pilin (type 1 fimbria component protein) [Pseudomonas sp. LAMO17WK12:I10]
MKLSVRKRLVLATGILATSVVAPLVQAATNIVFRGELVAASCIVSGNGSPGDIEVNMGSVSIADLGTGAPGDYGAQTSIELDINCASGMAGLRTVKMNFAPRSGSGLNPDDNRLLALTPGGASGVGIALIDESNAIVNLGAGETINAALQVNGDTASATLNMRAAYISAGAPAQVGIANATMPFTLTYE